MNQKALQILEYHKIIEKLTDKASSAPGKELCRNLLPETDLDVITINQAHTRDALSRLFKKGGISFGGLPNFTPRFFAAAIPSACR